MWTQLTLAMAAELHPTKARALMARIRQGWQAEALCAEFEDADVFFPVPSREAEQLADLMPTCAVCPVRRSCLAQAVLGKEAGLWGGTTERRRSEAIAELNAVAKVDPVLDRLLDMALLSSQATKGAA